MYWGLTSALDFQEEYKSQCPPIEEYNILIIGGADARHILKTASKYFQHEKVVINFYVAEVCLELVARQLLLLNIALESTEKVGLSQKVKIFMEIYGNTLLRPAVAKYLTMKSKQFIEMITNLNYFYKIMPNINLDCLKYKEKDYLELLFKYWTAKDPFFICEFWDTRVRNDLGVRYNSKQGAFDWDLHMKLHPAGAKQICPQEYKHWRETGVAYTWLESDVSKPNRTLVGGVVSSGEKYFHHGYLGDIVAGPFYAYGLHCKDQEMLKQINHVNVNRATDLTEYNLTHLFYELAKKEECNLPSSSNIKMGTIVMDLPSQRIVENQTINLTAMKNTSINLENIKINFISYSFLERMANRREFKTLFNCIYYSNLLIDKINPDLIKVIAGVNCLFFVENQKFIPNQKKEEIDEFSKKIHTLLTVLENVTPIPFNKKEDEYFKFLIN